MARPANGRLQGLVTVSGMVAFIGALAVAPRISITKTDDSTIIKYDHLKPKHDTPAPADPGLIIAPSPQPQPSRSTAKQPTSGGRKPFSQTDWIFDTGATTHVCTNRALLHSYDTLNPYSHRVNPRAVGYFGPNPIPIVGAGDCTLLLPLGPGDAAAVTNKPRLTPSSTMWSMLGAGAGGTSRSTTTATPAGNYTVGNNGHTASLTPEDHDGFDSLGQQQDKHPPPGHYRAVTRLTIKNVMHIPEAGVNLISWSQLKRAKGLDLRLVEETDGSLTVREHGRALMRFEPRDGLFFLVQADLSPSARQEIFNNGH
ncbi:hypothetical protein A1O1_02175 [Capronia coronata CBS 617.96]|uniref:Uncharacterized protein n=1 Tax=Capronia coronata CBS 617.96 TaxID=1182541 RepID=W9YLK7_9EURO|nr:uncharacterized protein A1O1_02175 [Capronia coronata CBS 617.96]EXJ93782.1 hypothetical protein A1O1_02175 [Capronia coronata CBS 617.96]